MQGKYRFAILVCSAVNCLAVGTCYLYGLYQPFIMDYFSVDSASASLPFTLFWMFMTFSQLAAGPVQQRIGVKATVALGLALMGGGFLACSALSPGMIGALVVIFAAVAGSGAGFAYNLVAATTVRWFPDKKGLATACSMGMMGLGGVVFSPICNIWLVDSGLLAAFRNLGFLFIPCIVLTLVVFKDVPEGYMADYVPKGAVGRQTSGVQCESYRDIAHTRDAYLLVLLYLSLVPCYLIANAVFVSLGVGEKGMSADMGVLFVSIASLCQIAGRFIITGTSDKTGRRGSFFIVFAVMAAGIVLCGLGSGVLYAVSYCLLSFAYGGGVTSMPAIITDRLGTKSATRAIAFAEFGTLFGSLVSSVLMKAMTVMASIVVSGVGSVVLGLAMLAIMFRPKAESGGRVAPHMDGK